MKRKNLMKTSFGVLAVLILAAGAIGLARALGDSPMPAAAAEPPRQSRRGVRATGCSATSSP